jgi:hypothetical protein
MSTPWPWLEAPARPERTQPPVPTSQELAIRCNEAFPLTKADAPPKRLTWARTRLRYTLTAHLCDGLVHLGDLNTEQARRLNHELAFLTDGTHGWEATDEGLRISYGDRSLLLPWVDPDDLEVAA